MRQRMQLTMSILASCFPVAVCSAAIESIFCAMFFCLMHVEISQMNLWAYRSLLYGSIGPFFFWGYVNGVLWIVE
jgi:hypothetical protein